MFRHLFIVSLLVLPASGLADYTVSGSIDKATGVYPLHPVEVKLVDPVSGRVIPGLSDVNDENGDYRITGVPEGLYKVLYDAIGEADQYIDELSGNVPCDNGGCDMTTKGSIVTVDRDVVINTGLTRGAFISGWVENKQRRPLAGAIVEFFDQNGEPYCCHRITDEEGWYERPVFWPGTYFARVRFEQPSGYLPELYKQKSCDGCDIAETGTPIAMSNGGRRTIKFNLEEDPDSPPEERTLVSPEKLSGSWYDPARNGEGFIVEVLDRPGTSGEGLQVVVFWFTYTPDGDQAWMVGSGDLVDGQVRVNFEITSGARFGEVFDPADVERESWGRVDFDFFNCSRATAAYNGSWGKGQISLQRLTAINGIDCSDPDGSTASGLGSYSGAWFQPQRDGEGFIVEVISGDLALVYWFTYDSDGSQMWLIGVGDIEQDLNVTLPMERTAGASFGDDFDPADVQFIDWGQLEMKFVNCSEAEAAWAAEAPFGAGRLDEIRLTELRNAVCPLVR